jgi:hypothetical protein
MMTKFLSRKFILAFMFTFAGCLGLLVFKVITGAEFVTLTGIVLGAFTAGDVALNAIHKKNSETPE